MPARQRRSSTSRISSRERVGERDVQDQEDAPDRLRDLEGAARRWPAAIVGLHVQRRDDAEHHREDAADEDGEEVVDARAAAPQPVQALQMEAERDEHGDERQQVDVLPQRGHALRDRNQAGVEAERVGEDERRQPEQRVGDDVEGDEQPVVALQHARRLQVDERGHLVAEPLAAEALGVAADERGVEPAAHARGRCRRRTRRADGSSTRTPVSSAHDGFERAAAAERDDGACRRPAPRAGTMPKSSSPGSSVDGRARGTASRTSSSDRRARGTRRRPFARAFEPRRARGRRRRSSSGTPARRHASMATSMRL